MHLKVSGYSITNASIYPIVAGSLVYTVAIFSSTLKLTMVSCASLGYAELLSGKAFAGMSFGTEAENGDKPDQGEIV